MHSHEQLTHALDTLRCRRDDGIAFLDGRDDFPLDNTELFAYQDLTAVWTEALTDHVGA